MVDKSRSAADARLVEDAKTETHGSVVGKRPMSSSQSMVLRRAGSYKAKDASSVHTSVYDKIHVDRGLNSMDKYTNTILNLVSLLGVGGFAIGVLFLGATDNGSRFPADFQDYVYILFSFLLVFCIVLPTAVLKLLDMGSCLKKGNCLHSAFGLDEGDSLFMWEVVIEARFADFIQGHSKNRFYAIAVWLCILSVLLWWFCVSRLFWIEFSESIDFTSLPMTEVIASVVCLPREQLSNLSDVELTTDGVAGTSSDLTALTGAGPACVNMTCSLSDRQAGLPCSRLPPYVSVAAFDCAVTVMVVNTSANVSSDGQPVLVRAGAEVVVEARIMNERLFSSLHPSSSTLSSSSLDQPSYYANGSLNRLTQLAVTDASGVARFELNGRQETALQVLEGLTSDTYRLFFRTAFTVQPLNASTSFSPPFKVLNDVQSIGVLLAEEIGWDKGSAVVNLSSSGEGPNLFFNVQVETRHTANAARFPECDQPSYLWNSTSGIRDPLTNQLTYSPVIPPVVPAGAQPPSPGSPAAADAAADAACRSECRRCRVKTAKCGVASSTPTSFTCLHTGSSPLWMMSSMCNEEQYCDAKAGGLELGCLQDDGGSIARKVTFQTWVFLPAPVIESANGTASLGPDEWVRADQDSKGYALSPILRGDGIKNVNGTDYPITTSTFTAHANGTLRLSAFLDRGAMVRNMKIVLPPKLPPMPFFRFKIQAVSQGVASDLSLCPELLVDVDFNHVAGCPPRGLALSPVNVGGMSFIKNAAWLLLLVAVPIIYMNREEVSVIELFRSKSYCTLLSVAVSLTMVLMLTFAWFVYVLHPTSGQWVRANDCRGYTSFQKFQTLLTAFWFFAVAGSALFAFGVATKDAEAATKGCCGYNRGYTSLKRLVVSIYMTKLLIVNLKLMDEDEIEMDVPPSNSPFAVFDRLKLFIVSCCRKNASEESPDGAEERKIEEFTRQTKDLFMFPSRFIMAFYISTLFVASVCCFHLWTLYWLSSRIDSWYSQIQDSLNTAQDNITTLVQVGATLDMIGRAQEKTLNVPPSGPARPSINELANLRSFQEVLLTWSQVYITKENVELLKGELFLYGGVGGILGVLFILLMWIGPGGMFSVYRDRIFDMRRGVYFDAEQTIGNPFTAASNFPGLQGFHCVLGYIVVSFWLTIIPFLLFNPFFGVHVLNFILEILIVCFSISLVVKKIAKFISNKFVTGRTVRHNKQFIRHRLFFEKLDAILLLFSLVTGAGVAIIRVIIMTVSLAQGFFRLDISLLPREKRRRDAGYGSYCAMIQMDHCYNNPITIAFISAITNNQIENSTFQKCTEKILLKKGLLEKDPKDILFRDFVEREDILDIVNSKAGAKSMEGFPWFDMARGSQHENITLAQALSFQSTGELKSRKELRYTSHVRHLRKYQIRAIMHKSEATWAQVWHEYDRTVEEEVKRNDSHARFVKLQHEKEDGTVNTPVSVVAKVSDAMGGTSTSRGEKQRMTMPSGGLVPKGLIKDELGACPCGDSLSNGSSSSRGGGSTSRRARGNDSGSGKYEGTVPYNCTNCGESYESHDHYGIAHTDGAGGGLTARIAAADEENPMTYYHSNLKWWLVVYLTKCPKLREYRKNLCLTKSIVAESVKMETIVNTRWKPHVAWIQRRGLYYQAKDEVSLGSHSASFLNISSIKEDQENREALFPPLEQIDGLDILEAETDSATQQRLQEKYAAQGRIVTLCYNKAGFDSKSSQVHGGDRGTVKPSDRHPAIYNRPILNYNDHSIPPVLWITPPRKRNDPSDPLEEQAVILHVPSKVRAHADSVAERTEATWRGAVEVTVLPSRARHSLSRELTVTGEGRKGTPITVKFKNPRNWFSLCPPHTRAVSNPADLTLLGGYSSTNQPAYENFLQIDFGKKGKFTFGFAEESEMQQWRHAITEKWVMEKALDRMEGWSKKGDNDMKDEGLQFSMKDLFNEGAFCGGPRNVIYRVKSWTRMLCGPAEDSGMEGNDAGLAAVQAFQACKGEQISIEKNVEYTLCDMTEFAQHGLCRVRPVGVRSEGPGWANSILLYSIRDDRNPTPWFKDQLQHICQCSDCAHISHP